MASVLGQTSSANNRWSLVYGAAVHADSVVRVAGIARLRCNDERHCLLHRLLASEHLPLLPPAAAGVQRKGVLYRGAHTPRNPSLQVALPAWPVARSPCVVAARCAGH